MDSPPTALASLEGRIYGAVEQFRACSARRRQIVATMGNSAPKADRKVPVASFESLMADVAGPARSALEDVIAAVTAPQDALAGVEPNSPRFMVRVANVDRPHRPTKRNYDYFKELDAALAARHGEQPARP
jgi:hypothetical protein